MQRLALAAVCITTCIALVGCDAKVSVDLASSGLSSANQVDLSISGVDMLDSGGSEHQLTPANTDPLNILDYTSTNKTLIDSAKLADGTYTGLRLTFSDRGSTLQNSSGDQFIIDTDSEGTFADVDLKLSGNNTASRLVVLETRFSLYPSTTTTGHYVLTPVLRVVETDISASITGTIDPALVGSTDCQQGRTLGTGLAVYLFSGTDVTPHDYVQDVTGGPVASANVIASGNSTVFSYSFPYLEAGSYTLALTCNADGENPTIDDGLIFFAPTSVVLSEKEVSTVNLSQ